MKNKNTILITGASGYVGEMLADRFSEREDVEKIICLDKDSIPELLKYNQKIIFIQKNLVDSWEEEVGKYKPNIIINAAWQIRELYGDKDKQKNWNINGSDKIFNFSFKNDFVKKIVHFSTVASYGAFPENNLDEFFTEENDLRDMGYLYADEKKLSEENLKKKYQESDKTTQVFIIRPASITGPKGRLMRNKFGLQSALSGQIKKSKSIWEKIIGHLTAFTPITPKWMRQFVHEDDINDIISILVFEDNQSKYEIFNAVPPGEVVTGKIMADSVGKKALVLHPSLIKITFFIIWHLSFGKIPTSKGGWKTYSFPIPVDGSKVTQKYLYKYKFNCIEAFTKKEGHYAKYLK